MEGEGRGERDWDGMLGEAVVELVVDFVVMLVLAGMEGEGCGFREGVLDAAPEN